MKKIQTIIQFMRFIGLNGLNRHAGFMVCLLVCLFISCTSEVQEPEEQEGVPIELAGYLAPFEDSEGGTRAEPAWMPEGYTSLTDMNSIGAFFTQSTSCDVRRIWWHDTDEKWYISGKSVPTGDFYLYGYLPYNSAEVGITPKNSDYAEGASLTFHNMSSISTKDICVIVAASNGTDEDTPTRLQTGKFDLNMKAGGPGAPNHVFLLCDHLYSKLEFTFRVDNSEPYKYASLRTIKLRKLELTSYTYTLDNQSDASIMKKKGDITVNLAANDTGESPVESTIYFSPDVSSGNMDPVLLFEGEKTLPSDSYTTETGYVPYFNLSGSGKVMYILRSTYDVYDKQNNLIRKGCVAENTIIPQERFNIKQFNRGHKYTLRLTIMPTYLYMLSEPDLNNPSVDFD